MFSTCEIRDIFKKVYFLKNICEWSFTLNLIQYPQTHNLSISYWMDFVFLYTDNSVINLLFNDVIWIYLSVSFYSIAFIANHFLPQNKIP